MICSSLALQMNLGSSLPKGTCHADNLHGFKSKFNFDDGIRNDCILKSEVIGSSGEVTSGRLNEENCRDSPCRLQLEDDVQRLQKQLQEEMDLHAVLENALDNSAGNLAGFSCLPHDAQELLSNISTLEVTVSRLEEQIISLHYQLTQERNERKLVEYHLKQSQSKLFSLSASADMKAPHGSAFMASNNSLTKALHTSDESLPIDQMESTSRISCQGSATCSTESTIESVEIVPEKTAPCDFVQFAELGKPCKEVVKKGILNHPNLLSEEMVRCMKNIFTSLADSSAALSKSSTSESCLSPVSPHGLISNSSSWSLSEISTAGSRVQSPQIDLTFNNEVLASDYVFDPYRVRGKQSWADIGNYGSAVEVSWMSVGKKQLEFAAGALRRFRLLVEQLAKVNPIHLSSDEKLAFWINLYNALVMHAYLAYGVPKSDLKLFSLMQKAAYTVGGHSFTAAAIEYGILKMKPPLHRPQTALLLALHKLKVSEEQKKFAIDTFEPLATFALSCGMYSSPAVRIFTPGNVREELQEAQRDFIRASVGLSSKGKLLVPKLLHCFARGFTDDAHLAVWISRFLPSDQAAFVEQCVSRRRQSFLASRNCGILPFDSHFRYLFLPEVLH